jgi:two-component system capsular synthesis response regulator RcsB
MNAPRENAITVAIDGRTVHLTPREAEILRLYGAGMTVTDIATGSNRSVKTISAQLARIQDKISVESRAKLRVFATQWNMGNQGS